MLKIQIIGTYPATPPQVVPICPHPPGVQPNAGDAWRAERSRGSVHPRSPRPPTPRGAENLSAAAEYRPGLIRPPPILPHIRPKTCSLSPKTSPLSPASGAGVCLSAAPAPQISILRATAAQVTHSFSHLRHPTPRRKRIYTKGPGQLLLVGSSKNGGYLLSHLVGQYHRR